MGICSKCGLPEDLCVCDVLEKEQSENIVVYLTKSKFKKVVTIIEGITKERLQQTVKELKHKLACGGTVKGEKIVLQGDHRPAIKQILVKTGYLSENITIEQKLRR
ncbi:stress response translation initiation inhibitor YciH [Candidatus Micrarchaeota archaeon]|nr:stress response translation initiation inhibitor YciH [Candidatus Micrarchaeota archaeon]